MGSAAHAALDRAPRSCADDGGWGTVSFDRILAACDRSEHATAAVDLAFALVGPAEAGG